MAAPSWLTFGCLIESISLQKGDYRDNEAYWIFQQVEKFQKL
jgi:hypothetical protein